jgi:hypothetical protein
MKSTRMCIDISKPGYGFIHDTALRRYCEKQTHSYLKKSEHSPLSEALQKQQKGVAGRILQTEYNVRVYEPSKPEKK